MCFADACVLTTSSHSARGPTHRTYSCATRELDPGRWRSESGSLSKSSKELDDTTFALFLPSSQLLLSSFNSRVIVRLPRASRSDIVDDAKLPPTRIYYTRSTFSPFLIYLWHYVFNYATRMRVNHARTVPSSSP